MKRLFLLVGIILYCSSCATLLNKPTTYFDVITNTPTQITVGGDTLSTVDNKLRIETQRGPAPLEIQLSNDSISKAVQIPASYSSAYWWNLYPSLGIGMIFEHDKDISYTYKGPVYIDMTDTIGQFFRYYPFDKTGQFILHLSIPYFNNFYLQPDFEEETMVNTGFWGLSLGVDYYHSRQQYFHLSANASTAFFLPVPAAVDVSGEVELVGSLYVNASHHHVLGRLTLGYGMSMTRNAWEWRYYDAFDPPPPTRPEAKRVNNSMGMVVSSYFRAGKRFQLGVLYRPTFLRFATDNPWAYEHQISLDLAWKFRLSK